MIALDQFLKGAARSFDIGAVLSSYDRDMEADQADFEALKSDWEQVGLDLYKAIADYEQ
ncbi:MAG: hypothetical protein LBL26_08560 [Peptococcaceae bacterium]|jgi:hypothetical protein|nr:hypothetical protein [Peptococcaceae bacterium]